MLISKERSEGSRRLEHAWYEALAAIPDPSCKRESVKRKRPSSLSSENNSSFGGILNQHIVSVERTRSEQDQIQKKNDDDKKKGSVKIRKLLSEWDQIAKREKLLALVRLFKRLDPVLTSCKRKLQSIESGRTAAVGADHVSLESLIAYGRRISAHVRAPPEYNDPTGNDCFCVPGYFFPCPDYLTMSRSALFHADKIRAVPPTITFIPDARTRAMYWIDIKTPTPNPTIRFAINSVSSWNLYVPGQKPYVAGAGQYTVRAYCQSEGFFGSEVTVANIDIPPSAVDGSSTGTIKTSLFSQETVAPLPLCSTAEPVMTTTPVMVNQSPIPTTTPSLSLRDPILLGASEERGIPAKGATSVAHDLAPAIATSKPAPTAAPVNPALKFGGLFLSGSCGTDSSESEND